MQTITTIEDIGQHEGLITGTSKDSTIRITSQQTSQLAAVWLSRDNHEVCIFYNPSTEEYFIDGLRERILGYNYNITREQPCEMSILRAIYNIKDVSKGQPEFNKDNRTEIQQRVDEYFERAIKQGASDIFIITTDDTNSKIQFRLHGRTIKITELSKADAERMSRVIYDDMADSATRTGTVYNPTQYQEASITRDINGRQIKVRWQSLPIFPDGNEVTLRLLVKKGDEETDSQDINLISLGYDNDQARIIHKMASSPSGVMAFAGPVGSGKTTTIKHLLQEIVKRDPTLKVRTVENPPEYIIHGASQTPVAISEKEKESERNPFTDAIKAVMRAAFDVILIGEVRDKDTAELLKQIQESGHFVFTTCHAGSAPGIINRFSGLGISRSDLSNKEFWAGMVYQRLVPILCTHCRVKLTPNNCPPDLYQRINQTIKTEETLYLMGPGCDQCNNQGISGRTVCAELLVPNLNMLELISKGNDIEVLRYWIKNMKGKTAVMQALEKMKAGILSPVNVEYAFGPLDTVHNFLKELQ